MSRPNKFATFNVIALIRLLIKKGIITKEEFDLEYINYTRNKVEQLPDFRENENCNKK